MVLITSIKEIFQLTQVFNSLSRRMKFVYYWNFVKSYTEIVDPRKITTIFTCISQFMSLKTNVEYLDKDFQDKAGDVIMDLYLADFYKVRYAIFSILFLISHLAATQPTLSY